MYNGMHVNEMYYGMTDGMKGGIEIKRFKTRIKNMEYKNKKGNIKIKKGIQKYQRRKYKIQKGNIKIQKGIQK